LLILTAAINPVGLDTSLVQIGHLIFVLGWMLVLASALWIVWSIYMLLKMIDYVSAIEWTYLQITLPLDAEQTPKAMEHAFDVWGGLHKGPDLVEEFFEGYLEAWYSCELQCTSDMIRYIMVIPTAHRKFFEGVIYGQYPSAEVKEVEDYTRNYQWQDIGKTFDMYGTEMILTQPDFYPIKTYKEYEDSLAPEERFIDPHQSLVEAYSNVLPGEEYWLQILIRPIDAKEISAWAKEGEKAVKVISGQAKKEKPTGMAKFVEIIKAIPGDVISILTTGVLPEGKDEEKPTLRFFNPYDEAKMTGILEKTSKGAFRAKIRLIYIAPAGKLNKPNISRAIGVFKQFNTFHLNNLKPDPETKTNGPGFIMKKTRRGYRAKKMLLYYQWRDFWGLKSGQMYNAEELATLYHFPAKWIQAPGLQRAKSGLQSAPENLPYA
jgi:hypothetical protein